MLQLEQGWSRGSQFPWRRSKVLREGRRAGEGSAGPFAALRPGCPQTPPKRRPPLARFSLRRNTWYMQAAPGSQSLFSCFSSWASASDPSFPSHHLRPPLPPQVLSAEIGAGGSLVLQGPCCCSWEVASDGAGTLLREGGPGRQQVCGL